MRLSKVQKEILSGIVKGTIFKTVLLVLQEHGVNGMTMDRVTVWR